MGSQAGDAALRAVPAGQLLLQRSKVHALSTLTLMKARGGS